MADFDPAVADQLSAQLLNSASNNSQLNGAMGRNMVANTASVLTLGVQQTNAASLKNITKLSPMAAAAAAQTISSQHPSYMAGLATASGVPRAGGSATIG